MPHSSSIKKSGRIQGTDGEGRGNHRFMTIRWTCRDSHQDLAQGTRPDDDHQSSPPERDFRLPCFARRPARLSGTLWIKYRLLPSASQFRIIRIHTIRTFRINYDLAGASGRYRRLILRVRVADQFFSWIGFG